MKLEASKTTWGAVGDDLPYPTFKGTVPAMAADGFGGIACSPIGGHMEPGIGTLEPLQKLCGQHGRGSFTLVQTFGDTGDRFAQRSGPGVSV